MGEVAAKRIYTTGDVARLCKVCDRTAARWCDEGALPAYRIPLSRHRRVQGADLVAFMRANGIPVPPALAAAHPESQV